MSQAARILSAIQRGAQDAKTIARMARVPRQNVHPLLFRLRQRGLVKGFTGDLRPVAPKPRK